MVLENILINSDVIIDYLRGLPQAITYLNNAQAKNICSISVITIAELYSGVREDNKRQILENFLKEFRVTVLNETLAQKAGLFRRDYGKSHGVGLADCLIAATAESLESTLITLNKKHFPMLKKVKIPYKK